MSNTNESKLAALASNQVKINEKHIERLHRNIAFMKKQIQEIHEMRQHTIRQRKQLKYALTHNGYSKQNEIDLQALERES
jgi:hypothetical protein